jgi:hypothetical protein
MRWGPDYPLQKEEGFRASLKTSALAPVCLPRSREAGWMSDVFEFSMSSPVIRGKPEVAPEQIERRSTSGQAGFRTGSSSPPRTVGLSSPPCTA